MALSVDFAVYGDLNDRIISLAADLGHRQEISSMDEIFINLASMPGDLVEQCHKVCLRILRWVGIPCDIGIGPTKTPLIYIAKTAKHKPDSYPAHLAQVCNLAGFTDYERHAVLAATPVGEVWGVGRRIAARHKLTISAEEASAELLVRNIWQILSEQERANVHRLAQVPKQKIAIIEIS